MGVKKFRKFLSEGPDDTKRTSALRKFFKIWSEVEDSDGQLKKTFGRYDVRFPHHPFGLRVPFEPDPQKQKVRHEEADCGIHFVGWPGYTDTSVYAMFYSLGRKLCFTEHGLNDLVKLRRIYVERESQDYHDLYHEVVFSQHSTISGGCNDNGGTGMSGAGEIDEFFRLIRDISLASNGQGIEEIFLPYKKEYSLQRLEKQIENPPCY